MNWDAQDLASQAAATARPSPNGWWRAQCPFCPLKLGKTDRKFAFAVRVESGNFRCWRCGTSGRLREAPKPSLNGPTIQIKEVADMRPPPGFYPLYEEPATTSIAAEPARAYLRTRNLAESLWSQAGIGACLTGKHFGRVIIPLLDDDRKWLGWVGRAWTQSAELTYRYPRGMNRGELLYNHAALFVETDEPVMIVEGVFDALALWPHAVAVLGKPSHWQVEAMLSAKRPVAIVLDGDAHEEGWALAMRLRFEGKRAGSVRLPPQIDPDEIPLVELQAQARACLTQ